MQKISTFSTEKIFDKLFNNKSKTNYWDYIGTLRRRASKDIYSIAKELVKSSDKKRKIIGINIFAQFGYPRKHKKQILNVYFKLLKEETDIYVVSAVLHGIGHNNDNLSEERINTICRYHSHRSATVRFSLTLALCGVSNGNAIDTLILLSRDKDIDVRDWATFGIGSDTNADSSTIREALWERVTDTDSNTRQEAIIGLAIRKDKRVKEFLIEELDKADEWSSSILEAIESFNDKDFIPLIEDKIVKNKTERIINEDWLQKTLDRLKAEK